MRTGIVQQVRDDLERVALVDEELLPLGAVVHLLRVLAHQRVEEGIELAVIACALAALRHVPQDDDQSLTRLQSRAKAGGSVEWAQLLHMRRWRAMLMLPVILYATLNSRR